MANMSIPADAKVSVFDHGLLYGDGIFEGIRIYGGNVFRLDDHLERLELSAKAIMLTVPLDPAPQLAEAVCETCRRNKLKDGYIRLVITRGVGDLGLAPVVLLREAHDSSSSPARSRSIRRNITTTASASSRCPRAASRPMRCRRPSSR